MKPRHILLAALAAAAISIPMLRADDFNSRVSALVTEINQAADDDYNYVDACATELTGLIVNAPDSVRGDLITIVPMLTGIRSACAAGMGDDEAALRLLGDAVTEGYDDYNTVKRDTLYLRFAGNPRFEALMDTLRLRGDYMYILSTCAPYTRSMRPDTLPVFTYESPSSAELERVRRYFNLDSVAGDGDDLTRIGRVLRFVNRNTTHDGVSGADYSDGAIEMYQQAKAAGTGLNCRYMAKLTNQLLLALGYKSRYVTCMPRRYINDCHVINAVWVPSVGGWLYADPMYGTFVYDMTGRPLTLPQVRSGLIDGTPMRLDEDATYNGRTVSIEDAADYLNRYMTKNLYYMVVPVDAHYAPEQGHETFVALTPTGFDDTRTGSGCVITNDDTYFWQPPQNQPQ